MAKDIVSAYRSVSRDLRGLQAYAPIARRRLEHEHGILFKGKMPSSGSMCYVPLDLAIPSYNEAVDDYNETMEHIHNLTVAKEQLEKILLSMSDIEQTVALLMEQGNNLVQIARKTNYSYNHVWRIATKVRKMENQVEVG